MLDRPQITKALLRFRRTADVRSVGYSELFSLSREDVLTAMKDYPEAQVSGLGGGGGGGSGGGSCSVCRSICRCSACFIDIAHSLLI